MADAQSHIKQTGHNQDFLANIKTPSVYPDWRATVMFYVAVHYVDSFLAKYNEHPIDHRYRRKCIMRMFGRTLFKPYKSLEDASQIARYQPNQWKEQITSEKITELETDLNVVKSHGARA